MKPLFVHALHSRMRIRYVLKNPAHNTGTHTIIAGDWIGRLHGQTVAVDSWQRGWECKPDAKTSGAFSETSAHPFDALSFGAGGVRRGVPTMVCRRKWLEGRKRSIMGSQQRDVRSFCLARSQSNTHGSSSSHQREHCKQRRLRKMNYCSWCIHRATLQLVRVRNSCCIRSTVDLSRYWTWQILLSHRCILLSRRLLSMNASTRVKD